jgi:hypothetical protein
VSDLVRPTPIWSDRLPFGFGLTWDFNAKAQSSKGAEAEWKTGQQDNRTTDKGTADKMGDKGPSWIGHRDKGLGTQGGALGVFQP